MTAAATSQVRSIALESFAAGAGAGAGASAGSFLHHTITKGCAVYHGLKDWVKESRKQLSYLLFNPWFILV